jgi:hypothetical protein
MPTACIRYEPTRACDSSLQGMTTPRCESGLISHRQFVRRLRKPLPGLNLGAECSKPSRAPARNRIIAARGRTCRACAARVRATRWHANRCGEVSHGTALDGPAPERNSAAASLCATCSAISAVPDRGTRSHGTRQAISTVRPKTSWLVHTAADTTQRRRGSCARTRKPPGQSAGCGPHAANRHDPRCPPPGSRGPRSPAGAR